MTTSETKKYWLLFALAAATFAITLSNVQYTGDEAVYPLMSYEMWYHGHILTPVMYGQDYWRLWECSRPQKRWKLRRSSRWNSVCSSDNPCSRLTTRTRTMTSVG